MRMRMCLACCQALLILIYAILNGELYCSLTYLPSVSLLCLYYSASFIGDATPQENPLRYLGAIRTCFGAWQTAVKKQQHMPLIVNTPGWVTGTYSSRAHSIHFFR